MISPDWMLPDGVCAYSSTRQGGVSSAPYESLNLGLHVGDEPRLVEHNRKIIIQQAGMPSAPVWLNQTHSVRVAQIDSPQSQVIDADGSFTRTPGVVCAVMTADCVPVLLANKNGSEVAAVHAGWRGLANGILENALDLFSGEVMAWIGPCIGSTAFEVGEDVVNAFIEHDPLAAIAFCRRSQPGKWFADLNMLVSQRLKQAEVNDIAISGQCTYHQSDCFFSYRRDGVTGRQASFIWIK